jgi:hypothetical protein
MRSFARAFPSQTNEYIMKRLMGFSCWGIALAALVALASVSVISEPANAVVYCKTAGVPKGCVARPVARPVVVAPAARHNVVYCKTRGVPKGCVMR